MLKKEGEAVNAGESSGRCRCRRTLTRFPKERGQKNRNLKSGNVQSCDQPIAADEDAQSIEKNNGGKEKREAGVKRLSSTGKGKGELCSLCRDEEIAPHPSKGGNFRKKKKNSTRTRLDGDPVSPPAAS